MFKTIIITGKKTVIKIQPKHTLFMSSICNKPCFVQKKLYIFVEFCKAGSLTKVYISSGASINTFWGSVAGDFLLFCSTLVTSLFAARDSHTLMPPFGRCNGPSRG